MSDESILEEAQETVGVRAKEYGPPTENFGAIAGLWSEYLGIEITPYDYSQMMILAKIGRNKTGSPDRDTHVDQAGYSLTTDLVHQDGSEPGEYHGTEDFKNVPLGIDDAIDLADGASIVIESVDGTPIKLDTTLDPDA